MYKYAYPGPGFFKGPGTAALKQMKAAALTRKHALHLQRRPLFITKATFDLKVKNCFYKQEGHVGPGLLT